MQLFHRAKFGGLQQSLLSKGPVPKKNPKTVGRLDEMTALVGRLAPMKIPIFPGKYHENGGFSMAMLKTTLNLVVPF